MTITEHGKIPPPVVITAPDPETFHGRLEIVRRGEGISGNEMARRLEVPEATFATWLKGTVPNDPDVVELANRIERVFGVNWVWMIGGPARCNKVFGVTSPYPRGSRDDVRYRYGNRAN